MGSNEDQILDQKPLDIGGHITSANDSSNNLIPKSLIDENRNNKTPAVIVQDDVFSYDIVNNVRDQSNINMINIAQE